jgi:ABC-2 type transport system permease protein
MPAFILPQILLCGLLVPREDMAGILEAISWAMPMTYAYDALERVTTAGSLGGEGWGDLAVTIGAIALALVLGATTLRRRTG